jgi:hypothetical protein
MHVVRAAFVGGVFGLLVIGTGSLWLAIVLHAAMDLIGGPVGGRAFRAAEQHAAAGTTSPSPSSLAPPARRPGAVTRCVEHGSNEEAVDKVVNTR